MKLLRRQINPVKRIQENPRIEVRELAEMLNVSIQTVKTDLQLMADVMKDYDVVVEILSGGELRVWGRENINYMLNAFQMMQEFSPAKQVTLLLTFHENFVVLQDIADILFISKSLAEKVTSVLLKKYPDELDSVRRHGIRNISSQLERRGRFSEIVKPYVSGLNFVEEIKSFHMNHFPILDFIERAEVERAASAINFLRSIEEFSFADEASTQLFLQLIFAESCHRRWENVHVGNWAADIIQDLPEGNHYRATAEKICELVGLDDAEECDYFSYLFLMLRKQKISDNTKFVGAMREVILEVFEKILGRFAIDFRNDTELFNGLAVHIYSTVIRRDKFTSGPIEEEIAGIRNQYPFGFEMATVAAEVILKRFSYRVSPGEMMYLALHFQAGIERRKNFGKKIRVLVVCHYGLAAASLIAARIERTFPAVEIIDNVSMQNFLRMSQVKADLILSTENISTQEKIPVIYVTPLLPDSDLKQIGRFIETKSINNSLILFVQNALILEMNSAQSKSEIFKFAADKLLEKNFVTEEFFQSVMMREEISATDIDDIAIPHGNPDFVLKTQLVIVRLKNSVRRVHSNVKLVFLFAVSREQFEKNFAVFSSFYKRLGRVNVRLKIRKSEADDNHAFKKNLAHLLSD